MRSVMLAVALVAFVGPAASASTPFACERGAAFDPDVRAEVDKIAHNNAMRMIVTYYRARWDAAYIRKQCEAYAQGNAYDFSCIKPHRDWDAIRASIPDAYFHLDARALRPFMLDEQTKNESYREAEAFCREVRGR